MERASSTTLQGPQDDNIVPLLHLTVFLCMAMSVMLFVEKVYMAIIILVKLFRKRPGRHPERQYTWEPTHEKEEILVHIPMFNEKEVHQLSIGAACRVSWTSDWIIIQVLDDSTDSVIKERKEVMEDENERNQEEKTRTTEEKEDENERNQEEGIRTTEDKEDENERNQEEEIRTTENERNQEEEIRTTEQKKRRKRGGDERKSLEKRRKKAEGRWKRGGDMLGERKSQAKRRKIAEVNQDDEGRKKKKQQCRWMRSCMAMGCAAIFMGALIYLCAENIPEEETIYLVPT